MCIFVLCAVNNSVLSLSIFERRKEDRNRVLEAAFHCSLMVAVYTTPWECFFSKSLSNASDVEPISRRHILCIRDIITE